MNCKSTLLLSYAVGWQLGFSTIHIAAHHENGNFNRLNTVTVAGALVTRSPRI